MSSEEAREVGSCLMKSKTASALPVVWGAVLRGSYICARKGLGKQHLRNECGGWRMPWGKLPQKEWDLSQTSTRGGGRNETNKEGRTLQA